MRLDLDESVDIGWINGGVAADWVGLQEVSDALAVSLKER